jgi:vacuolar protein sorting-associated protein 13A/C
MNEVQLWCKVSEPRIYCDKPEIESQYNWISEWKIETTDNTDDDGWEYSIDFDSLFSKSDTGKYVRRRKWVRYAN